MNQILIQKPSEMIQHTRDAIVHRSIMRSKYGSITLFAIDDLESITEHKSSSDEFIYVVDGSVEVVLDGDRKFLTKGNSQHITPNTLHTVHGNDSGIIMLVIIRNNNR